MKLKYELTRVASSGKEHTAFASLRFHPSSYAFGEGYSISVLYVPEQLRRCGIATALLTMVCSDADSGKHDLWLDPVPLDELTDLTELQRLYERFNFVTFRTRMYRRFTEEKTMALYGDIHSKHVTDKFRENFDMIFGKKDKKECSNDCSGCKCGENQSEQPNAEAQVIDSK